jgi:hypothetical protein
MMCSTPVPAATSGSGTGSEAAAAIRWVGSESANGAADEAADDGGGAGGRTGGCFGCPTVRVSWSAKATRFEAIASSWGEA